MSSCSDDLCSHPDKKLETHLFNVAENSMEIFRNLWIEDNLLYANISFLIGLCHDFAKATTYFQNRLNGKGSSTRSARHSFLSSVFGYYVVKKYIDENNIETKFDFPLISYLCIRRHHGDLCNVPGFNNECENGKLENENMKYIKKQLEDLRSKDISNFKNFYLKDYASLDDSYFPKISVDEFLSPGKFSSIIDEIKESLDNIKKKLDNEKSVDYYLILVLFFSVLIDSDKLDASNSKVCSREKIDPEIVDLYKKEKFKNNNSDMINKKRDEAYKELMNSTETIDFNNKIYSITLPTGSGKTISAFSFALKLREKIHKKYNFKPRIIYSLPFLSIIDQNEKVLREILFNSGYTTSNFFIKHNSMSDLHYKTDNEEELSIDNSELLIEGWYSEIIITTLYQLLHTLISNKNRSLRKFHNLVNSIIIIDEVQAIPGKYWTLINELTKKIAEKYNIWFILMTATQPLIFNKDEIKPLIENESDFFNYFNRVNYIFHKEEMTITTFKEEIMKKIEKENNKDIMIVLNTIKSSLDVFNHIKNNLKNKDKNSTLLCYLSTNIIPKERLERIKKIKNSKKRKIIVTTQLIEAGVDIDMDIIYRDFTTIDSIIQTAGRCNRNNQKDKGTVHIVKLKDEKGKKYSYMIYDEALLDTTNNLIPDNQKIDEKEFNKTILNNYYKNIKFNKDPLELLESIKKLKMNDLKKFKLIEKDYEKIEVFIKLDEAEEIWNKYQQIKNDKEKPYYTRKKELKEKRNDFNNFVISVNSNEKNEETLKKENDNLYYIENKDLKKKYDEKTGFIPK